MASPQTLPPPPTTAGPQPTPQPGMDSAQQPPAQPGSQMDQGSRMVIEVVQSLRAIAKAYPAAAPVVAEINNMIPKVARAIMQSQTPGEPMAPPVGA